MRDDSKPTPAPAVRRLASWLRDRARSGAAPSAPTDDRAADETPPPPRLRPQPEDDASVYPLF
ncbi:hypothetical protein ACWCPI_34990 [Streptomyces sp. NPDC001920]